MTTETHDFGHHGGHTDWRWYVGVPAAGLIGWLIYGQLIPLPEWTTALLPVARYSHTGEAIAFFVYDVPKVLLLLTLIVFVTGVLRSWFSPEKTRAILAGQSALPCSMAWWGGKWRRVYWQPVIFSTPFSRGKTHASRQTLRLRLQAL